MNFYQLRTTNDTFFILNLDYLVAIKQGDNENSTHKHTIFMSTGLHLDIPYEEAKNLIDYLGIEA